MIFRPGVGECLGVAVNDYGGDPVASGFAPWFVHISHLSRPLAAVESCCGLLRGEWVDGCEFAESANLEGCVQCFSAGFEVQPVEFGEAGAWLAVDDNSGGFGDVGHWVAYVFGAVFRCSLGVKVGGVGVDGQLNGKAESAIFHGRAGFEVGDKVFFPIGEEEVEGSSHFDFIVDDNPFGHTVDEGEASVGQCREDRFDVCLVWVRGDEAGVFQAALK